MIRKFRMSICTDMEVKVKDIDNKVVEKKLINKLKDIEKSYYGTNKFEYCFKEQENNIYGPMCVVGGYYNASMEGSRPTTLGVNLEYRAIVNNEDFEFFKKVFEYLISIKWKLNDFDFTISTTIENPNIKHLGMFRTNINNISVEYNSLKDKNIDFDFNNFVEYILNLSK